MPTPTVELQSLARPNWTPEEAANAELVVGFVHALMNAHDFDAVRRVYGNDAYVQHNHGIAEGIDGVIATVSDLVKRFPEYSYDVKHVHVDGDIVIFHSHATLKAKHRGDDRKGFNIIDRWRIADGQIVEHWDAIQPIDRFGRIYALMVGGKVRNANGTY
ncbi:MAG: nuclear transport factor 2 family protein [Actinomycetota bacterium]